MGKKFNKSHLTKLFKGFRPCIRPKHKINLKYLEKWNILTSLQHNIVKDSLNKCTYTKTIKEEEGKEDREELIITFPPWHIAKLFALLEKPYNDAKVDHLGNSWERSKELTKEQIKKLNEKTAKEKRKGKSRKDIKKENNE